jgi:antitoxin component HigA of HigAB toxin-antitoxin module
MTQQHADYELAFNEISHALLQLGEAPQFWKICDEVEERLIDQYPEDEVAIIELVATWLVKLGVHPEGELQGFV